jgi:hypothetical protein
MTISEAFQIYWPLIVFVLGGLGTCIGIYTNMTSKINDVKATSLNRYETLLASAADRDKEIAELKGQIKTMQPVLGTIQTDIAVIKNTLEYIKGSVQSKPPVITNNN